MCCMFAKSSISVTQYRACEEVGITKREAVMNTTVVREIISSLLFVSGGEAMENEAFDAAPPAHSEMSIKLWLCWSCAQFFTEELHKELRWE